MADDFNSAMTSWLNEIEKTVNPSPAQRAVITGAGAAAFAAQLKQNTPRSDIDYSVGKGKRAGHAKKRKIKHLQDTITFVPGEISGGTPTGDTDVGFGDGKDAHYYDFVARITNNGRKEMSPKETANMHFADRAITASRPAVLAAMRAALKGGGE